MLGNKQINCIGIIPISNLHADIIPLHFSALFQQFPESQIDSIESILRFAIVPANGQGIDKLFLMILKSYKIV